MAFILTKKGKKIDLDNKNYEINDRGDIVFEDNTYIPYDEINKIITTKPKVNPTESYLLKRVKQLEKENKKLKVDLKDITQELAFVDGRVHKLAMVSKELAQHFEIRTDESDKFDFSYFGGSYLHVINKSGDIDKCDKALIDFLNYVKENL